MTDSVHGIILELTKTLGIVDQFTALEEVPINTMLAPVHVSVFPVNLQFAESILANLQSTGLF